MSTPEPILSDFLTKSELAIELGRHARTIDRWEQLGIGPPRTCVGRKVLYKRSSVFRWLAAQEQGAEHLTPPEPTQTADRRGAHGATSSRPVSSPVTWREKDCSRQSPKVVT
jgi:hypothetical protein